jgi:sugar transferase (PEP-CTERM system associated)
MLSVLNRYVPGRVFVLVAAENTLIATGIFTVASLVMHHSTAASADSNGYFLKGCLIAGVCQLTFYYFSLYDLRAIKSKQVLLGRLLSAIGVSCLALAILSAIFPSIRLGIGVIELTFLCMVLLILLGRLSLEWVNRWTTAGERILVVGNGSMSVSLVKEICMRSDLPIRLLGVVTEPEFLESIPDITQLGPLDDLENIIKQQQPQRIVIALRERRKRLPVEMLLRARSAGIRIDEAATFYEKLTGRIPVESIYPSTLIYADGFVKSSVVRLIITRFASAVAALCGLVLSAPLMIVAALLIRLESPGPLFYRQERVGKDGKPFDILKFRSMRTDAEHNSTPLWASRNDPRITRVGSIMRKLRIDELPQFVNILNGDMSFVGPRPERPYFVQLLEGKIPYYDLRHSVRPGVTGWAQVSYPYGATIEDAKNKLEYDLFYVKNASIAFDLAIIFSTVKTVVLGKGQ